MAEPERGAVADVTARRPVAGPRSPRPTGPIVLPPDERERRLLDAEARRDRQATQRRVVRTVSWQLGLLALLLTGWGWASGRIVDRLFLSDPVSVVLALWTIALKGTLWYHLRFTLTETLAGYALGASLGLVGALLVALSPVGEPVLRPFVLLAYATPKIALAPLMIIWFGIGLLPKIVLAASFVFFVVFLSTLAGVATVRGELVAVVRVMGASRADLFRKVVLPSALPLIVTSLRLTIPAALIGAIIGEFISANRGIGYLINAASSRYATAQVFAGIMALLVLVLLMNTAVSALERACLRWAPRRSTTPW